MFKLSFSFGTYIISYFRIFVKYEFLFKFNEKICRGLHNLKLCASWPETRSRTKKTTALAVVCVATRVGVKAYFIIAVIRRLGVADILGIDVIATISSHNFDFLLKVEPVTFKGVSAQIALRVAVGDLIHSKYLQS